ncbi:MAG: PilN domain-containing protein [Deltaproteobacteria bacterium]|nr:PilN domain-containing protein [Deltaproteobacteria bacterium]
MKLDINGWWQSFSSGLLAGADGLGVYLDDTALTLAHVEKGLKGLQVRHIIRLDRERTEDLAPRLKEAVSQWGLQGCPVSLAVSRDLGFLRPGALPQAAAENLSQVVAYELDRFLPLPAERLYYDYQVLGETDTEIHLMLMGLPREPVDMCLNLLSQAGLRAMAVELSTAAVANSFSQLAGKLPSSWLLLHLKPGAFELAQIRGQAIIACHQGRSSSGADLNRILTEEIGRLTTAGHDTKALCLYGQGLQGFQVTAVSETFNLKPVYPSHLAIQNLPPETEQDGALAAVGAALRGLGKVSLTANLLPVAERAAVHLGRFSFNNLMLLGFLGLCLLWGGSALIHQRVVLYQVNRHAAALESEARQVERQLEESRTLAKQMENFHKMGSTPDKLRILKDLTQLIPDNTWLFNLRLSRQNLDISGMSKSASDLIPLLEKSGWLTKTEFASPIVTDANKQEHFKIKADFKGGEPVS